MIATIAAGLIIVLAAAMAQAEPARLGLLAFDVFGINPSYRAAFERELAALGHVEGQSLQTLFRSGGGSVEATRAHARELVAAGVKVLVAHEGFSTQAAIAATKQIPIVIVLGINLPEQGIVASYAKPGGNVTGLDRPMGEIGAKRLEFLKELVPAARRFAMLADGGSLLAVKDTERAALALGASFAVVEVNDPNIERAFAAALGSGPDAMIIESGPFLSRPAPLLAELTRRHRLPATHTRREFAEAGGLMSFGPDYHAVYRRAAHYVDRILKGVSPADMPVERPTKFELVVNVGAAKALGLAVPPALLMRADEVIE